jgi:uncharacterized protein (TIGR02145 family)
MRDAFRISLLGATLFGCGGGAADSTGPFVDSRDGHSYSRVTIAGATWMGENLAWEAPAGSFCYDDAASSCVTGGRLYTFAAAMNACPKGWHLSTDAEWQAVEAFLGMPADELDFDIYSVPRGSDEGTKLKEGGTSGLDLPMTGYAELTDGAVTRWDGLTSAGKRTYLWTSTPGTNGVLRRRLEETGAAVYRFSAASDGFAVSVRCVAD